MTASFQMQAATRGLLPEVSNRVWEGRGLGVWGEEGPNRVEGKPKKDKR